MKMEKDLCRAQVVRKLEVLTSNFLFKNRFCGGVWTVILWNKYSLFVSIHLPFWSFYRAHVKSSLLNRPQLLLLLLLQCLAVAGCGAPISGNRIFWSGSFTCSNHLSAILALSGLDPISAGHLRSSYFPDYNCLELCRYSTVTSLPCCYTERISGRFAMCLRNCPFEASLATVVSFWGTLNVFPYFPCWGWTFLSFSLSSRVTEIAVLGLD